MRARKRRGNRPTLRFTPYAWSKLLYLRDAGHTEVGGFGISGTSGPQQLLRVEDVRLVSQQCTAVSVEFDDTAVADHFDRCVDEGRAPEQFARIWIHTHPGDCALPSPTDEDTFARCFGHTDWAVMFILADNGATYARLQFHIGPAVSVRLQVQVEFETPFAAAEPAAWDLEYEQCVSELDPFALTGSVCPAAARVGDGRAAVFRSSLAEDLDASDASDALLESLGESADGESDPTLPKLPASMVAAELEEELAEELDQYGAASLSEADVDDWYERWMAEAVFDPEVVDHCCEHGADNVTLPLWPEALWDASCAAVDNEPHDSPGKEDRWPQHLCAASV